MEESEYSKMQAEFEKLAQNKLDNTLREDWEIGIWEGKFSVRFAACCSVCNLQFEFKHEDKVG